MGLLTDAASSAAVAAGAAPVAALAEAIQVVATAPLGHQTALTPWEPASALAAEDADCPP